MIKHAFRGLPVLLALAGLACAGTGRPHPKEASAMETVKPVDLSQVDHVILGIRNLQQGIDELERRTGVRAAFGGVHPGRGTQNALISLGDGHYLEILAPNPGERTRVETDYLRVLTSLQPVGWAVHTKDVAALQQELRGRGIEVEEIRPGARDLPDGSHLAWKTMEYSAPTRLLPFFIEWEPSSPHPSATSPKGCRLKGLYLEDPEAPSLEAALRPAGVGVEARNAKKPALHVSLSCPKGEVDF